MQIDSGLCWNDAKYAKSMTVLSLGLHIFYLYSEGWKSTRYLLLKMLQINPEKRTDG